MILIFILGVIVGLVGGYFIPKKVGEEIKAIIQAVKTKAEAARLQEEANKAKAAAHIASDKAARAALKHKEAAEAAAEKVGTVKAQAESLVKDTQPPPKT